MYAVVVYFLNILKINKSGRMILSSEIYYREQYQIWQVSIVMFIAFYNKYKIRWVDRKNDVKNKWNINIVLCCA